MLEHHPPHVRRKIALMITAGVAFVLVVVFILIYTHTEAPGTKEPSSRLNNFYNTILDTGQQYFGDK